MRRRNSITFFFKNFFGLHSQQNFPRDPLTYQINIFKLGTAIDNGKF